MSGTFVSAYNRITCCTKFPLRDFCILASYRATPEGLFRFAERTAGTSSLVSYPGASVARKQTYRASARGYPSSYHGFWKTSPDLQSILDNEREETQNNSRTRTIFINKRFAVSSCDIKRHYPRFFTANENTPSISFTFIYLHLHCHSWSKDSDCYTHIHTHTRARAHIYMKKYTR